MPSPNLSDNYRLPAFPPVAVRVLEMFADEEIAVVQLAAEIKVDPVLTARILQASNSPAYRAKSEISTLEHAISWIGKSEVAGLVLSFKLESFSSQLGVDEHYFRDFWCQSFIQGCAMSRLAEACGRIQRSEASVCGLLLDFGRLALLDRHEAEYCQLVDEALQQNIPLHELERQRLKTNHAEIGAALLRSMSLPERYAEAALCHALSPAELEKHLDSPRFSLIAASVASAAVGEFFCCHNQGDALATIDTVCRRHLQLVEQDIKWLMDCVRDDIEKKATLFSVNVQDLPSISHLLGQANEQLVSEDAGTQSPASDQSLNQLERENELLRKLVASLEDRTCRDPLTGVYNRDYFAGRLLERIRSESCHKKCFAILVIDIDDFNSINEGHGHLAGDFAISWTAKFIDSFIPDGLVARYGGDEFIALVEVEDEESLQQLMQQLCTEIENRTPGATRRTTPVTISVGAVLCQTGLDHSPLANRVFDVADLAMSEARGHGGSRCKVVKLDEITDPETGAPVQPNGRGAQRRAASAIEPRQFSLAGDVELG